MLARRHMQNVVGYLCIRETLLNANRYLYLCEITRGIVGARERKMYYLALFQFLVRGRGAYVFILGVYNMRERRKPRHGMSDGTLRNVW